MFQPPNYGSSVSGYRNFAYRPTPGKEANELALADFAPNYDAALSPFIAAFGPNSTFVRWLMGTGRSVIGDMFEANKQREIAMGFKPFTEVAKGETPLTSAMDFMKGLNLHDIFSGQSSDARGEDPLGYSPFVRFFNR